MPGKPQCQVYVEGRGVFRTVCGHSKQAHEDGECYVCRMAGFTSAAHEWSNDVHSEAGR